MQKNKYKGNCLSKGFELIGVFLSLLIVSLPGWLFDLTYYGKITIQIFINIVDMAREIGLKWNISYSRDFGSLGANFAILISAVSLMISVGTSISNRSENKVYGISRMDLNLIGNVGITRWLTKMVFCAPILMMVAIMLKCYVASMCILIFSYACLALMYFRFNSSFDGNKDREKVSCKLKKSASDISRQIILENISSNVEKEGDWSNVELLYEVVIEDGQALPEPDYFSLCFCFFDTVFMRSKVGKRCGLNFLKKRILSLNNKELSILENKEYIVIWAMLSSVFLKSKEKAISELIRWVLEMPGSQFGIRECDVINDNGLVNFNIIMGMILIQLEFWMRQNKLTEKRLIYKLPMIWQTGKTFLGSNFREKLETCSTCGNQITEERMGRYFISRSINNLVEDYEKGHGRSMIYILTRDYKEE